MSSINGYIMVICMGIGLYLCPKRDLTGKVYVLSWI
jgi:hypothetical protein